MQLYETPLNESQRITDDDGEHFILEASVLDDWSLHWWLLSFGDKAEVLGPKALREHFTEVSQNLFAMYHQGSIDA